MEPNNTIPDSLKEIDKYLNPTPEDKSTGNMRLSGEKGQVFCKPLKLGSKIKAFFGISSFNLRTVAAHVQKLRSELSEIQERNPDQIKTYNKIVEYLQKGIEKHNKNRIFKIKLELQKLPLPLEISLPNPTQAPKSLRELFLLKQEEWSPEESVQIIKSARDDFYYQGEDVSTIKGQETAIQYMKSIFEAIRDPLKNAQNLDLKEALCNQDIISSIINATTPPPPALSNFYSNLLSKQPEISAPHITPAVKGFCKGIKSSELCKTIILSSLDKLEQAQTTKVLVKAFQLDDEQLAKEIVKREEFSIHDAVTAFCSMNPATKTGSSIINSLTERLTPEQKSAVFSHAMALNQMDVATPLINTEPSINIDREDVWKGYPIIWAIRYGNDTMINLLLQKKVRLDVADPKMGNALNAAVVTKQIAAVEKLLDQCDINGAPGTKLPLQTSLSIFKEEPKIAMTLLKSNHINLTSFSETLTALAKVDIKPTDSAELKKQYADFLDLFFEKAQNIQFKDTDKTFAFKNSISRGDAIAAKKMFSVFYLNQEFPKGMLEDILRVSPENFDLLLGMNPTISSEQLRDLEEKYRDAKYKNYSANLQKLRQFISSV